MKVFIGVIASIFALLALGIGSYISNYNFGNRIEKEIAASYENNQNILSQYSVKIKEMAQVPDMYAEDLKGIYSEVMAGRYGDDGSKAMWQWIQEKNPQVDASLYTNIQQAMEAGRNKFENSQTILIDKKRTYETALGSFWSGMWLNIAGYPKIELDDYKVIKSTYSNDAFESGVEDGIELN